MIEGFVGLYEVGDGFARMQYRCVVLAAYRRTDGCQGGLRVLFAEVHGYLAGLCYFTRAFGRIENRLVYLQVVAHDITDVFYRYLLLVEFDIHFQNFFGQRDGYLPAEECRVGDQ